MRKDRLDTFTFISVDDQSPAHFPEPITGIWSLDMAEVAQQLAPSFGHTARITGRQGDRYAYGNNRHLIVPEGSAHLMICPKSTAASNLPNFWDAVDDAMEAWGLNR